MRCLPVILLLVASLALVAPVRAALEIQAGTAPPVLIGEVYQRDGVAFVAIDEVLHVLGITGQWDNVAHVYRFATPAGAALISPGSRYLRIDGRMQAISHQPRFIDGKLRVSEAFLADQLAPLLQGTLQVRNLDPTAPPATPDSPLEQFFVQLMQHRPETAVDSQWIVAIDPGHGGQDAGCVGKDGSSEQAVNLELAQKLLKLLKMRRAAPVIMTRDADYAVGTLPRLELVAGGHADVLLSLHAQSSFAPSAQGIMLFVAPDTVAPEGASPADDSQTDELPAVNASRQLAEALRTALTAAGYRVAPVQERSLLPLGQGNLPRVLIEMGYLTNVADLARLRDPASQALLAQALFNGLEAFLTAYQALPESPYASGQSATQQ